MMNGWGWIVKLLRRFTSWNHIVDDSSVSFGIAVNNNKQTKQRRISDANQWSYTNLLKQNRISDATQWSYTNLHRQRNKKRIPDTNKWIYTSLLKQNRISDATQWTYTDLLKRKEQRWNREINCQSIWT